MIRVRCVEGINIRSIWNSRAAEQTISINYMSKYFEVMFAHASINMYIMEDINTAEISPEIWAKNTARIKGGHS